MANVLHYDPRTRDAELMADGSLRLDHEVDSWMDLNLTIPQGTLKSSPNVGHRFRLIRTTGPRAEVEARTEVARVAKPRVDAKDVRIERIDVDTSQRGQLRVAVLYTNLRTGQARSVKAT